MKKIVISFEKISRMRVTILFFQHPLFYELLRAVLQSFHLFFFNNNINIILKLLYVPFGKNLTHNNLCHLKRPRASFARRLFLMLRLINDFFFFFFTKGFLKLLDQNKSWLFLNLRAGVIIFLPPVWAEFHIFLKDLDIILPTFFI